MGKRLSGTDAPRREATRLLPAIVCAVLLAGWSAGPAWGGEACAGCLRIETDHTNSPEPAREAFAKVEETWGARLASPVPVRIRVTFRALKAKATTIPNPDRGFPGAVDGETWYPAALADALAGKDLNPGEFDMEIFFSDWIDWHYDPDQPVPENKVDFISVALHEVAHGLGFASRMSMKRGGTFVGLEPGRKLPELSFELPDLLEMPTIFDRFIETDDGKRVMEIPVHGKRRTELGHAVLRGELYFGGRHAATGNASSRPRLDATDPSHVHQATYEWTGDGLMTPKALKGRAIREPGPIVMGVLRDIGWEVAGSRDRPATMRIPQLR